MGKKAKLTKKEKAKAKKTGTRDSVKGIKKALHEKNKKAVRVNRWVSWASFECSEPTIYSPPALSVHRFD